MNPPTAAELAADAELAFLALYAEDAFAMNRAAPKPDPRLSPDWTILGTLTAQDAIMGPGTLRLAQERVFYGWLLHGPHGFVVAIRGTESVLEWLIDCEFAQMTPHSAGGAVESGFWSVYETLEIDGKPFKSVADMVNGLVAIVGHSLGAAVATYAALDLAQAGAEVQGRFIASPHPGNGAFSAAFGRAVPDHRMYRNMDDAVPRVPFWFGYCAVPNVEKLDAAEEGVEISGGLAGQHHVLSYSALMSRATFEAFRPLPIDQKFVECVKF